MQSVLQPKWLKGESVKYDHLLNINCWWDCLRALLIICLIRQDYIKNNSLGD